MTAYPHLLSPLRVAGQSLPNRMVMGAMHTRLETMDRPLERLAAFYAARAQGEVALILTGGYAPVPEGVMDDGGLVLNDATQLAEHRVITSAVQQAGGKVVLQILHAGRYAKLAQCVAPSALKARINRFTPRALETAEVWSTVRAFAHTAALAQQAGYVGVEIMGSEGYLLNEFTAAVTNLRDDAFGGSFDARIRFPLEVIRAVRAQVGPGFIVIYRISSIDLMEGGMTADEIARLAQAVQGAGADIINTGVGWHESAVPTIAASVPRAAWVDAVRNIKRAVTIPVMASNRINTPEVAEDLLASGAADLVSMARPLLADPDFARKTRHGLPHTINTCIACNQACLDNIFTEQVATCLVNPRAGRELDFAPLDAAASARPRRIAVVGAGPAGMAFAVNAAQRGHAVTLLEAAPQLGGQLNLAKQVPGKREFVEMLRYFATQLADLQVDVRLNTHADAALLATQAWDDVVVATGVQPRTPAIAGIHHAKVLSYVDVLTGKAQVGERVAIIGAGGIGFDVAEFLLGDDAESTQIPAFQAAWGVDARMAHPGGLVAPRLHVAKRHITMLQRKPESLGRNLGKSTGWILKAKLRRAQVEMVAGAQYDAIDDAGLHYRVNGEPRVLDVDHIIVCAGQTSERSLVDALQAQGLRCHVIGGADVAAELDALRAIDQATRLAVAL